MEIYLFDGYKCSVITKFICMVQWTFTNILKRHDTLGDFKYVNPNLLLCKVIPISSYHNFSELHYIYKYFRMFVIKFIPNNILDLILFL